MCYHRGVYKIVFTRQAFKSLRKTPAPVARRIREKLESLAKAPYAPHPNVTKLKNRPGFQLRVGDWRVIYTLRDDELVVLILKIGHRGEIYR